MAVTGYGLDVGSYEALPNFRASRDDTGLYTAYQSFVMRRDSWEDGVSNDFARNTPITLLFPQLGGFWAFLLLESYDVSFSEGAIQTVDCTFKGFSTAEFDPNNQDITYTLSGTRRELPILQHPLFRQDVTAIDDRNVIAGAIVGTWKIDEINSTASSYDFLDMVNLRNQTPHTITDADVIRWVRIIFEEGMKTYQAPALQWTVETTNRDGLPDDAIDRLGLAEFGDDGQDALPPGDPPTPLAGGPWEWMKISLTSSQSTSSGVTTSQTWELSPPGGFIKFKDANGADTTQGPYNYRLALLG